MKMYEGGRNSPPRSDRVKTDLLGSIFRARRNFIFHLRKCRLDDENGAGERHLTEYSARLEDAAEWQLALNRIEKKRFGAARQKVHCLKRILPKKLFIYKFSNAVSRASVLSPARLICLYVPLLLCFIARSQDEIGLSPLFSVHFLL